MKIKKIVALLFGFLLFCGCFIPIKSVSASSQKIPIDMYLIAGQSNAVGYSLKGSLSETFENVGYAGAVNHSLTKGTYATENIDSFSEYNWSISAGLGRTSAYIGPEYGMAKILNNQYTGPKKAFIYKSGAGGTALRDINTGESAVYGNWYPRSLWASGYTPSMGVTNDPTGVQYQLFVENFKCVYNELVANGYAPTVKGMVWMQGCSDVSYPTEYETILKTFISDIRTDLVAITKDQTLSTMPFVIGKIATTYGSYNCAPVPAFNAMQQRVADSLTNVETVETSDLIIVNKDDTVNGTDRYHFNTNDALTLGMRFGRKLLETQSVKTVLIQAKNGQVLYAFNGNDLTLTFIPKEDHRLSALSIGGIDIDVNCVTNDTYTIKNVQANVTEVSATFTSEIYKISYYPLSERGEYTTRSTSVTRGETLIVVVTPYEGYEVQEVTFNGRPMEALGDNRYQIVPQESGTVKVAFSKIKLPSSDHTNSNEPTVPPIIQGCGSTISLISGTTMIVLASCMIIFLKKRT